MKREMKKKKKQGKWGFPRWQQKLRGGVKPERQTCRQLGLAIELHGRELSSSLYSVLQRKS